MLKVVIAPDSFKECITAKEAAVAIKEGFKRGYGSGGIQFDHIPMADGGEGTTQSLVDALEGTIYTATVTGPGGREVTAEYGISGDGGTAILEMAEASGISLVAIGERNPLTATTYGTGELIKAALDHGVDKIILGIGGSATNDGGAGMIQALGGALLKVDATEVERGGQALVELDRMDLSGMDRRLEDVDVVVACDVNNPLTGPEGASAIYGPQKGATPEMVVELDGALAHFGNKLEEASGKTIVNVPGAGAAGGLGAGLLGSVGARLEKGVDIALKETRFRERVEDADLVITGEGKIDGQTIYGKTPIGVAKAAKESGTSVIALCGICGDGYEKVYEHGIDAVFSLVPGPMDVNDAIANGKTYLADVARNVGLVYGMGKI